MISFNSNFRLMQIVWVHITQLFQISNMVGLNLITKLSIIQNEIGIKQ